MATSFSGEQRDNNEPSSSSSSWPAWSWFFHGKQALLGEHNNNEEVSESNFFGSEKLHTDGYSSKLEISKATSIAACFLLDYEHGRPPSLSPNVKSITDLQLQLHGIKFSIAWEWLVFLASALIFVRNLESRLLTSLFHTYAIFVFLVDLYMKNQFFDKEWMERGNRTERHWIPALLCLLTILGIQSWSWIFLQIPETHFSILMTSAFKPIVFFYASRRARDALEALLKIGKILLRVVIIELFLILAFAAVACRLYYNDESFHNLSASWLSLFECKKGYCKFSTNGCYSPFDL